MRGWLLAMVWAAAASLSSALGAQAYAASLQVSPTSVTLQARQNADGLTLTNTGTQPLHAQVRVFRWTQRGDEEKLEPTRDIVISPPMLQLAPGAQQLVRVIRLGPPPADAETSYRVIVDELPTASEGEAKPGLRFVLQYSVPVFLMPETPDALSATLAARVVGAGSERFLEIANRGKLHAQIADLAYAATGSEPQSIAPGLAGYVLPGNTRRWRLPEALDVSGSGTFVARINGEPAAQPLAPAPAP